MSAKTVEIVQKPIGDTLEATLARIEELSRAKLKVRARLIEHLAGKPAGLCCGVHNRNRAVDMEASWRATDAAGDFVVIYELCPECDGQTKTATWLRRAGAPEILIGCALANWTPRTKADESALATVKRFAARRIGFLILSGDPGLGKSHLAVGVMREFRQGIFIKQEEALLRLRKSYRDNHAEDVIDRCRRARLLVLDELIATQAKDELPMLRAILDYRYDAFLPTVLTTNLGSAQFAETVGERLTDRFRECATGVTLAGQSMRRTKRDSYGVK